MNPNPKAIALMSQAHASAKAQYAQVQQVESLLKATRRELDTLVSLGDNVTAEDIIKGAGALVTAGGSPGQLAGMLSTMPQGGNALAQWLQQQDLMVKQREAQLAPAMALARHRMGVTALRLLSVTPAKGAPSAKGPQASPTPMTPALGPPRGAAESEGPEEASAPMPSLMVH